MIQSTIEIASANKELMIRYGPLLDGLIFCVAIVRQTWLLRDDARQSRKIADASTLELATIRHDLRQSLISLKQALESSTQGSSSGTSDRIREGLDYIEALVQTPLLKLTGPAPDESMQEQIQPLELTHLFHTLRMMFAEEASSKRIDLTIVDSGLKVDAQPVQLLRVLANIISNAISHSGGNRILLGVRRAGAFVNFHCIDNGDGIDPAQFERLQNEYVKSGDSTGEGLGLNIISQICFKNGWRFLMGE